MMAGELYKISWSQISKKFVVEEIKAVISLGFKSPHRMRSVSTEWPSKSSHASLPQWENKVFLLTKYYFLKMPCGRGVAQKMSCKPKLPFSSPRCRSMCLHTSHRLPCAWSPSWGPGCVTSCSFLHSSVEYFHVSPWVHTEATWMPNMHTK